MCVYGPPTDPNFWPGPKLLVKALLEENYLNTLFLPSNVVFGVSGIVPSNVVFGVSGIVTMYFDKNKLNVTLQMLKCFLDAIQHQFTYNK